MTVDEVNLEIARRTDLLKRRIEQLEKALRLGRRQFFVWLVCLNTASLVAGLILVRAIRHLRPLQELVTQLSECEELVRKRLHLCARKETNASSLHKSQSRRPCKRSPGTGGVIA